MINVEGKEYPDDTTASVEVTGCGYSVKIEGMDPVAAVALMRSIRGSVSDKELQQHLDQALSHPGFCSSGGHGKNAGISFTRPRTDTGEVTTCPRRMTDGGPWERELNLDHWDKVGDDRVCSFCGSAHPEDFAKYYIAGQVERTTKYYKYYIHRPEVPNASFGAIKFYTPHMTLKVLVTIKEFDAKEQNGSNS